MQNERAYEFRKILNCVHQKDRRDFSVQAAEDEITIENGG